MKPKILVVDDSRDFLELMPLLFESEGYEVAVALDGREALLKLDVLPLPKIIFLDHDMDGMNGTQFLEELSRLHPEILAQIPILMITGREISQLGHVKVTEILRKPVCIRVLLDAVKKYVV